MFDRPATSLSLRLLRGPGALILGDHRQSLAVARSLCRAGYRVIAGRNGGRTILERSRYVAEVWDHPPQSDTCAWVEALESFCANRGDVGVVFPVGEREIELVAPLAARLPVLVAIADPAVLAVCRSKRALLALADETGVPTLPWEAVDDPGELERAFRRVAFPAVLKPDLYAEDKLGFKALIVHRADDARRVLAQTEFPSCGFVLQRLASGMRYNVYFVAREGKLLGHAVLRILRTDRTDATGLAVEGESVPPSRALVGWTEALTERLSYTGAGCSQFVVDGKDVSFLEINARLGANCAAACACGLDLPRLFIEACLGVAEPQPPAQVGRRYAWLYGDLHGLAVALRTGRIGWADARRWLARTALAELRSRDHVTWSWRDPLPTFAVFGRWLLELIGFVCRHAFHRRARRQ